MLLPFTPLIFRKRTKRPRPKARRTPPAPPALVLVSATYLPSAFVPRLTLVFDRAIDISGLVGSAIGVVDGTTEGKIYNATGAVTLLDANTVRFTLVETGEVTGMFITLSATNATGIVASDDGGTWAGADELELPFP